MDLSFNNPDQLAAGCASWGFPEADPGTRHSGDCRNKGKCPRALLHCHLYKVVTRDILDRRIFSECSEGELCEVLPKVHIPG